MILNSWAVLQCSLIKLVYFSTNSDDSSSSNESLAASNGDRWRPVLEGKLHFAKFETQKINDCIDFIRSKQLRLTGSQQHGASGSAKCVIKATGGGAFKYTDLFKEKLGISLDKADEMDCLVAGANFLLKLGGGYLFGLPVGFVADSIGATLGAGAAFLLGRTIGRSFVVSRLKDYPQFRAVAIAIRRSGFKIVLLLRLVPLLPFNMLNYLLSVTPVPIGQYMLASWIGMMPITFALVYVGTTLKDLSDVTHGWGEFSKTRWAFIILGLVVSVILMICVTRVAKAALEKALAENEDIDNIDIIPELPVVSETPVDLDQPLLIKIDASDDHHEK